MQSAKKAALRGITYGLYIVGTKDEIGVNAFTGNWLTQTSFEPPLVALATKAGTRSQEQSLFKRRVQRQCFGNRPKGNGDIIFPCT
ncbi:hypothetical protein QS257_04975 [Terrilactibacillus sp. S3-3]|nr:hypothetical protein QS257_04975 [Terrilactibacillus sp. S3-3]